MTTSTPSDGLSNEKSCKICVLPSRRNANQLKSKRWRRFWANRQAASTRKTAVLVSMPRRSSALTSTPSPEPKRRSLEKSARNGPKWRLNFSQGTLSVFFSSANTGCENKTAKNINMQIPIVLLRRSRHTGSVRPMWQTT